MGIRVKIQRLQKVKILKFFKIFKKDFYDKKPDHFYKWFFLRFEMDLLLTEDWDLLVDKGGNIATTKDSYAIAQEVANEIKLEEGEGWYDQTQGTPYFAKILGVNPNWGLIKNVLLDRAENVDGVVRADMDLYVDHQRALHGNIYLVSNEKSEGNLNVVF